MDQILQGVASTISVVFTINGAATDPDPDSATVTITRDSDGTTDIALDDPANAVGTGEFSFTIPAEELDDLDILTADWTATFDGEPQTLRTEAEVVGGFLFTIAEARAFDSALADAGTFSAAQIVEGRNLATDALETACGVAFAPRYARETTSGTGRTYVPLKWAEVRNVRSASVSGTDLSSGNLALVYPTGVGVDYANGFAAGVHNVEVAYEHGMDRPPSRAKLAAIRLCRHYLTQFPLDDRTTRFDTESGSFTVAQPGMFGQSFGIPEVDSFVADYTQHVPVG
jgi:hypothetical protein